ncbi:MAG: TIGR02186 family protein [Halocynthiibacter sp.]
MTLLRTLIASIILIALPALGGDETVVAGLSQNRVSITANFDGSEILIFGAVKREEPIPQTAPLQVIVTISGPSEAVMVRRKARRFGIWINTDAVLVDAAPSFYAVATTAPLTEILSDTDDLRYQISISRAIRSVGAAIASRESEKFTEAIIRVRSRNNLYQLLESQIVLSESTLFNTSVALPSNLTEGNYKTRIFLTREGKVIDAFETEIDVRKVGLERWIFNLAQERPLIYGLLSLFIAIVAGWGASAVFRYFRG